MSKLPPRSLANASRPSGEKAGCISSASAVVMAWLRFGADARIMFASPPPRLLSNTTCTGAAWTRVAPTGPAEGASSGRSASADTTERMRSCRLAAIAGLLGSDIVGRKCQVAQWPGGAVCDQLDRRREVDLAPEDKRRVRAGGESNARALQRHRPIQRVSLRHRSR